jgi:hypothetical protein
MSIEQKTNLGPYRTPTGRTVANSPAKPEGLVSHYPLSSVLVVFGVGLGIGVAVGCVLAGPATPHPSLGHRAEQAAGNFGRQMLGAISGVLPESLANHISA